MDLNGLKRCNDCFGYAAGDALMGNRIALMLSQIDLRVYAHKMNVGTIVFTGAGAVKKLVVLLHQ